ncbi:hypothetical protein Ancab_005929, partial [Ancistrocladus abbreviatus]
VNTFAWLQNASEVFKMHIRDGFAKFWKETFSHVLGDDYGIMLNVLLGWELLFQGVRLQMKWSCGRLRETKRVIDFMWR